MALPIEAAERIASELRAFDSTLKVKVVNEECHVIASTEKLKFHANQFTRLAEITKGWSISIGRSGKNVRLLIY